MPRTTQVTIDGRDYTIRRPTWRTLVSLAGHVGKGLARLEAEGKLTPESIVTAILEAEGAAVDLIVACVAEVENGDSVAEMDAVHVLALAESVIEHGFDEELAKNFGRLKTRVLGAIKAQPADA